jgi:hypothetical protein
MRKFEHCVVELDVHGALDEAALLDELGTAGWELVAAWDPIRTRSAARSSPLLDLVGLNHERMGNSSK